jgi:cyanophycinase
MRFTARRSAWLFTLAAVLAAWVLVTSAAARGHLVLVGGGATPSLVFERTLALSGGRHAIVAVLPQTYPDDSMADAAVAMWRTFGPREVVKVSRTDSDAMREVLERATLIWMPGGFPGVLMQAIGGTRVPEIIRARFAAGVTIGGASAGAMAMSSVMLADEASPEGRPLHGPATMEGLALWPEAIVSAHFTERRRLPPLQQVLAHHPALYGIGIDEGTAVIVSGGQFEVLGRGTVVVINPQQTRTRTLKSGARVRYVAQVQ